MKLFIMTKPPKDDLLQILPFLLGRTVCLAIEKHIKNGKLILHSGGTELELYSFVHQELNGFVMSRVYLLKNKNKYLQDQGSRLDSDQINRLQKYDLQELQKKPHPSDKTVNKNVALGRPRRTNIMQEQSKELVQFKNQLKKILNSTQEGKNKLIPTAVIHTKQDNKQNNA